jgi:hydrogenase nickel incorporation protein HypB
MCATCGCAAHTHAHDGHAHDHDERDERRVIHHHDREHEHDHRARDAAAALEAAILGKNDRLAEGIRQRLAAQQVLALNLMSSPGAGKTTLLERTIAELGADAVIQVIEGDQATSRDAERIRIAGAEAVQINTGAGCHLDAEMVERGLRALGVRSGALLFIENVGNLVCPALFDLGERAKVVVISVTEGEDKPLKYPHMFRAARLVLLNKVDLLPHVAFDVGRAMEFAKQVNPGVEVLPVSATRGDGLDRWYEWIATAHADQ